MPNLLFTRIASRRRHMKSAHTKTISYLAHNTLTGLINFFVPPRCANCNVITTQQTGICPKCWSEIRFIERPFCEVIGTPFSVDMGRGTLSTEAISNPPPFGKLRSAVYYDGISRKLISRFKFSDRNEIGPFIATAMCRAGTELFDHAEMIVPLPLHWRRFHARRFNQSAELARIIAKKQNLPFKPMVLSRIKNTRQQIGLSQNRRKTNMSNAFKVTATGRPQIIGKNILLIDDVYTSGATAKSATKTLLRAGAHNVDILTFAKVHSGNI